MFSKVVVANRGAVAARILRALYELNVRSVAVYSEADARAASAAIRALLQAFGGCGGHGPPYAMHIIVAAHERSAHGHRDQYDVGQQRIRCWPTPRVMRS